MSWMTRTRLRRLSTTAFWSRRGRKLRRGRRRAIFWSDIEGKLASNRKVARAVRDLIRSATRSLLQVAAGIALLEVAALTFRSIAGNEKVPIFGIIESTNDSNVTAFLGASVSIAATLLGLYYATVGIVASTIYKDVSGEVRDLFVRERSGEIYIRFLVLILAGGFATLVMRVLGYNSSGLLLLALAAMSVMTSVWLMVLGQRLFGFFDPSLLSQTLSGRIRNAIRTASESKTRDSEIHQLRAYNDACFSLATFGEIVQLIEGSSLRDARAPLAITRELLAILASYSASKDGIPTDSKWWNLMPKHQNWLTIDSMRLNIALRNSVGFAPERQPDHLWVEKKIADLLQATLAHALRVRGGSDVLASADAVAALVGKLAANLHPEEAFIVENAWSDAIEKVANSQAAGSSMAPGIEVKLNELAAAERLVLPLTQMWLGLVQAAHRIVERDLSIEFGQALRDPSALYKGQFPADTRHRLELFANGIRREKRVEGQPITPSWWVDHYAASTIAEALLQTEASIHEAVYGRTFDRITSFRAAGRDDLAVVVGLASLELLSKMGTHMDTIRAAEEKLGSYRNLNTDNEYWPMLRKNSLIDAASEHRKMLQQIALSVPAVRRSEFDSAKPDLYGQAYKFMVNGAFEALINGHHEAGANLYAACFTEMDHVRFRLLSDLKHNRRALVFSVEPIITCMELSGYALLMNELDDEGIWPQVKLLWDKTIQNNPECLELLMHAVALLEGSIAMTVGGMERTHRSILLRNLFDSRQIHKGGRFQRPNGSRTAHKSPVVCALAAGRHGVEHELHSLFISEYLADLLTEGTDIGHKAKSLSREISQYRADIATASAERDKGEPDELG